MKTMPRYVQVDNWIFEVKTVRALRVDKYGKPYSAIASITVNGDSAYIDGLLAKQNEAFMREDFIAFRKFCSQLDVKQANFDRFKNGAMVNSLVEIPSYQHYQTPTKNILRLVK